MGPRLLTEILNTPLATNLARVVSFVFGVVKELGSERLAAAEACLEAECFLRC